MHVISVVDDDASVLSATVDLLDAVGLPCEAFPSAEAYLASDRVRSTSCLILDVSMPGLNGVELQRRLLHAGHFIPTIFITAFPEERIQQRLLAAGAAGFLIKPFDGQTMIECLNAALGEASGNRI